MSDSDNAICDHATSNLNARNDPICGVDPSHRLSKNLDSHEELNGNYIFLCFFHSISPSDGPRDISLVVVVVHSKHVKHLTERYL